MRMRITAMQRLAFHGIMVQGNILQIVTQPYKLQRTLQPATNPVTPPTNPATLQPYYSTIPSVSSSN